MLAPIRIITEATSYSTLYSMPSNGVRQRTLYATPRTMVVGRRQFSESESVPVDSGPGAQQKTRRQRPKMINAKTVGTDAAASLTFQFTCRGLEGQGVRGSVLPADRPFMIPMLDVCLEVDFIDVKNDSILTPVVVGQSGTADIRFRVRRHEVLRDACNATGGNGVARKRISKEPSLAIRSGGEGIVNLADPHFSAQLIGSDHVAQYFCEVSTPHQVRLHRVDFITELLVVIAGVIHHEEGVVLNDGASHDNTKLILFLAAHGNVSGPASIEGVIAVEPEALPMKVIGPRLGDHFNGHPGIKALLGVLIGLNPKFLDQLGRRARFVPQSLLIGNGILMTEVAPENRTIV